MKRIHLVHGIHTAVGDLTVKNLIPYLKGFEIFYPDYGWIAGLETRVANPLIVRTMLPYIQPGDLFIGHSNGCAIGYDLMGLGAPLEGAIFINAALERKISRPVQVKWIEVLFNPGDEITETAQLAEELGLVDKVWGEMGHAGYEGTDPKITNINCGLTTEEVPGKLPMVKGYQGLPIVKGHSDIFHKLDHGWGQFIADRLRNHLPEEP